MSAFFNALMISAVIGLVILIPIIAHQYRKWGTFSISRVFLLYCFLVYVIALPCYTLAVSSKINLVVWCAEHGGTKPALNPMHTYYDFKEAKVFDKGIAAAVKTFTFQQVAFNVLLFVPIGMFLRKLFRWHWWWVLLTGFGISFLIEFMQLTGNFGLAPCSYRQPDVEDLITNTTGTLIGILIAPLLSIVPGVRLNEKDAGNPRPVTRFRRASGSAIDAFLYFVLTAACNFAINFMMGNSHINISATQKTYLQIAVYSAIALFMFVIVPLRAQGATLGKLAVRVVPRRIDQDKKTLEPPHIGQAIIKLICGPVIFVILDILILATYFESWQKMRIPLVILQGIYVLTTVVLMTLSTKGLSGIASGLVSADDRSKELNS